MKKKQKKKRWQHQQQERNMQLDEEGGGKVLVHKKASTKEIFLAGIAKTHSNVVGFQRKLEGKKKLSFKHTGPVVSLIFVLLFFFSVSKS